jgi:Family of unknown function (DUF6496)
MPKLSPKASKIAKQVRMHDEMHKFKTGSLHSGSKHGPTVKSRAQAIAIALHQSGQSRKDSHKRVRKHAGKHIGKHVRKH